MAVDSGPQVSQNLLFITADQLRADCLGCAGHPVVRTPHLDSLAAQGVRFAQHFTTAAPCASARACLHTGLYMSTHRVVSNGVPLRDGLTNWALEVEQQTGLHPRLIGYVDTAPDPRSLQPHDEKLQRWDGGYLPGLHNLPEQELGSAEWLKERGIAARLGPEIMSKIEAPGFVSWNGWQGDTHWMDVPQGSMTREDAPALDSGFPSPASYDSESSDTFVLTSRAIEFISRETRAGQPWVLHLSLLKPHPPILAPEPYNTKYHPDNVDMPSHRASTAAEEAAVHPYLAAEHEEGTLRPLVLYDTGSVGDVSDHELRLLRASYYGLISEVDDNIGRLLAALAELGVDNNTVIVFTSDHGELLGEHWLRGKVGFHDAAFRVPLIIRDPKHPAGTDTPRVVASFTEHVDLAPTIVDLLGLSLPRQFQGRSLRPLLGRPEATPQGWRSAVHFEFDYRYRSSGQALRSQRGLDMADCSIVVLRTGLRKLVHFGGGLPVLLFDLEKDPGEARDVAKDAAYAGDLTQLLSELLRWRMRYPEQELTHVRVRTSGSILSYGQLDGATTEVAGLQPSHAFRY